MLTGSGNWARRSSVVCIFCIVLALSAQTTKTPKLDDKALEEWATPIAALGVRPGSLLARVLVPFRKSQSPAIPEGKAQFANFHLTLTLRDPS